MNMLSTCVLRGGVLVGLLALAPMSAFPIPRVVEKLPRTAPQNASIQEQQHAAAQAYTRGITALAAGDLSAAEKAFRQVLDITSNEPNALLGLAEVAFKRGQTDEAGNLIRKAVASDPANANAHASLGRYLALKGQTAQAQGAFKRAVELDAKAFRPRIDLADSLLSRGLASDALSYYQEAVALQPDHAGVHYGLGMTYLQLGELIKARAMMERCVALDARNPLAWLGMSRVFAAQKVYDQALVSVEKALALQPGLVDALIVRADLETVTGQPAKAVATLEQAAAKAPKQAPLRLQLAMALHSSGQTERAEKAYRQVIELAPSNPVAYNNLADLLSSNPARMAEALRLVQRAVDLAPKDGNFLDTKGWIQRGQGDLRGAQATLEQALELRPDEGVILYHLAVVYLDSGLKQKARQFLQKALAAKSPLQNSEPARKLLDSLGA